MCDLIFITKCNVMYFFLSIFEQNKHKYAIGPILFFFVIAFQKKNMCNYE